MGGVAGQPSPHSHHPVHGHRWPVGRFESSHVLSPHLGVTGFTVSARRSLGGRLAPPLSDARPTMATKQDDWQDATGGDFPETYSLKERGDEITGTLVEVEEGVGPNNARTYHIERDEDGETYTVWGSTQIDRQMDAASIEPGDMVKITHTSDTFTNNFGTFDIMKVQYRKAE